MMPPENSSPPLYPGPPLPGPPMGQTLLRTLVSSVTAPVSAKARPLRIVEAVSRVTLACARIFPSKEVAVPSVAELPTCQNRPSSDPPLEPKLVTTTDEPLAVVSELPIWKTQYALLLPCALRSRVPVN